MRIATWNVNSIRTRLPHVLRWWDAVKPDVLCLQETKVENGSFPYMEFEERGLHIAHHGQKSYNGVAILSRKPLENVQRGFVSGDLNDQPRVLAATVDGCRVYCLYCPQGQDVDSEKFAFKRDFYKKITEELAVYKPSDRLVLCGDYNIAPADIDVDDPARRAGKCMFTEEEHGWLETLKVWGLQDALRVVAPTGEVFSWWDYRENAFQRNRGMRIDYHLVTQPVADRLVQVDIYREERAQEQPSDHVPVMIHLV